LYNKQKCHAAIFKFCSNISSILQVLGLYNETTYFLRVCLLI
jgi:hypothetical protein